MPAEFRNTCAAAHSGTDEHIQPRSRAENSGSVICGTRLHYCNRCKTVRTVAAVVSRVLVQALNGETNGVTTWTCSCLSCGSLMLGSSAGNGQALSTIPRLVCRRRLVSKSAVQQGRS